MIVLGIVFRIVFGIDLELYWVHLFSETKLNKNLKQNTSLFNLIFYKKSDKIITKKMGQKT